MQALHAALAHPALRHLRVLRCAALRLPSGANSATMRLLATGLEQLQSLSVCFRPHADAIHCFGAAAEQPAFDLPALSCAPAPLRTSFFGGEFARFGSVPMMLLTSLPRAALRLLHRRLQSAHGRPVSSVRLRPAGRGAAALRASAHATHTGRVDAHSPLVTGVARPAVVADGAGGSCACGAAERS